MVIFRDPVHDIIKIEEDENYILRLINTRAMQRLRRIRCLGLAWLVYPGAEHSRFCHSLGTYHLAKRVIRQLEIQGTVFSKEERVLLLTASLLHDIGHGPFSHLFETICKKELGINYNHEDWTKLIIAEDIEVNKILKDVDSSCPQNLINLFSGIIIPHYLTAIVSSQLDVDRFDYLLRDTYMTGAQYGNFDHEWILKHLSIKEIPDKFTVGEDDGSPTPKISTIVIDGRKGLSAVEQHILARHYMYKHVYLHKTIRAAEAMVRLIIRRAAYLINKGEKIGNRVFQKLVGGEILSVEEYMMLNDFILLAWIEEWATASSDKILLNLCDRFVKRDLFGVLLPPEGKKDYADERDQVKEILGADYEYSFIEDETTDVAFKDYFYCLQNNRDPEEIWYLDEEGNPNALSGYKGVIMAAKDSLTYGTTYWHLPKEVIKKLNKG